MYQIEYQKTNGDIFYRVRNTLPNCGIGGTTSMGWKVLGYKEYYKGKYYDPYTCNCLWRKLHKKQHIKKSINKFFKKYASTLALFILIPLYLYK